MNEAFIPYGHQSIDSTDAEAVVRALHSGWLTTGPAVTAFEDLLRSLTAAHAVVAVSSGTAALHAAYAVCGLGPGSELLTTPLTFVATAAVALHLGADVRFADVRDDLLTIDVNAVGEAISPKTRVVTAVDYAGNPADLLELLEVTSGSDCTVIEDASHSLGGLYRDEPVGARAPLTTFSFHPVKTVTTAEGGAIAVNVPELESDLRRFINHGMVKEPDAWRWTDEGSWHQEVQSLGLNYRMPDLLAALGTSQLARLKSFGEKRCLLVTRYRELLANVKGISLVPDAPWCEPVWHLFPVRILGGRRRSVFEQLRRAGIGAQVHYLPVHLQPIFLDRGFRKGDFPVSEKAYEELISLPLFPDLSEGQQERVVDVLRRALTSR